MEKPEYTPLQYVLFPVRKSIRYHHKRRRFFDGWHKAFTFLSLVGGSATVVTVLKSWGDPWAPMVFGLLVTLCSALDMVIGTAPSARLHHDLVRRFIELEKEIILSKDQSQEAMECFQVKRLEIEADEPPPLMVLNTICHNEQLRAQGNPAKDFAHVGFFQRLFSPFFDFQEHKIVDAK